ncbi:MAG: hypothetical protein DMF49_06145 [Acidobacteria bacterium]|nr:MAG: hypothetical protein DMF49_06145 [Acidobacteriota bacterium]
MSMKKLFYLAFCAAAALSFGCVAITYPLITDNAGQGVYVVNTNGKAHLIEKTQTSLSDGTTTVEYVAFVDQAASGHQKLTDYELQLATGTTNFHSDTYCNPDWTGCAWFTHNYTPPGQCTFYDSGSNLNFNCLTFLTAFGTCPQTRNGECGRQFKAPGHLTGSELSSLINMGVERGTNLNFNFNANNTHITLQNPTGSITSVKLAGNTEVKFNLAHGTAFVDVSSPTHAQNIKNGANLIDKGFRVGVATLTYGNVTRNINYTALPSDVYRKNLLQRGQ